MEDPNRNTWDEKDQSSENREKAEHKPARSFPPAAAAVLIILVCVLGIKLLSGIMTGADGVKDIADIAAGADPAGSEHAGKPAPGLAEGKIHVDGDMELEEEDAEYILEFIVENIGEQAIGNTLVLDYSDAHLLTQYQSNILDRLDEYRYFVLLYKEGKLSDAQLKEESQNFQHMVSENMALLRDTPYSTVSTTAQTNRPGSGQFIISIKYLTREEAEQENSDN